MSVNRENVIWQSANGTWNRGFYDFWDVDTDKEDWDYEWDVEYGDDFNWVSTGHPSEQAAHDSWHGSNPGGSTTIEHTPEHADYCAKLDAKAQALIQQQAERAQRSSPSYGIG